MQTSHHRKQTFLALVLCLLPTLMIWQGVRFSGFTADDYMVLDIQSPIRSFVDAISMFWRHDPNPQYWRPLTNSTVSIDFWLWGWNGGMFHVTNLLLHLVATALVYFLVLRIFRLPEWIAVAVTLLFGIAAAHDANLLWIAARSDVIAAITILATLLAAYKAQTTKQRKWQVLSWLFFLLALASKEVSALAIALLPTLVWTDSVGELWQKKWQLLKKLIPYLLVAAVFIAIRLQFTVPLDQMQPITAEGSRSPVAFAKNVLYSIGYIIAPLDFQTASTLINRYLVYGSIAAAALFIAAVLLFWRVGKSEIATLLYKPFVLILITGLVSFQSFERWRVYLPSAGVFVILALVVLTLWKAGTFKILAKGIAVALVLALFGFNIYQAVIKQSVWAKATKMIEGYKHDFAEILSRHPERPITLNLITTPIKLGDAQLIQLSSVFLPIAAEAERKNEPGLAYGSLGSAKNEIRHIANLDIYALDPDKGFDGLIIEAADHTVIVGISSNADLAFAPNIPIRDGIAKRDRTYLTGSSYNTYGAVITVMESEGAFIRKAGVAINDSAGLPIYFDGEHIRELKARTGSDRR